MVDQHRDFLGAALSREQARVLLADGHPDSRRRERVSRRDLPIAEVLGRAGLSQSRALQQGGQGRPLRRLGTTAIVLRRAPRRIQILTLTLANAGLICPSFAPAIPDSARPAPARVPRPFRYRADPRA